MTGPAIILLVVSILIIWGGLVGAIILLRNVPAPYERVEEAEAKPEAPASGKR